MRQLNNILALMPFRLDAAKSMLAYAQSFSVALDTPLTLLIHDNRELANWLDELNAQESSDSKIEKVIQVGGKMVDEAIHRLGSDCSTLVIFDELQRLAILRQTSFGRLRKLMEHLCTPLLEVDSPHWPIRDILLCSGGLPYSIQLEKFMVQMAKSLGARIRLMHVIAPVTREYKLAKTLHTHWQDFLELDTTQAQHMRNALKYAESQGVEASFRVKHGPVREMIEEELRLNEYQLIAMGSTYSSRSLTRLYRADMTSLISLSAKIPLLTMRGSENDSYD